ncbi:protein translocase subunit SecD [Candidatus Woesebacteria bacterium]|nr:MAG: protein translocase subunit SecD [Candidatus Woesebacteria bacterium]
MFTPLKKVIIIFVISLIACYISLPREMRVNIGPIDRTVTRHDINISLNNINLQKNFDLALGLDLAGGSHLVFEADTSNLSEDKKSTALTSLKSVIESRVNFFGISEPNVQSSTFEGKDRIIVELPGVSNTTEAIDLIGQTAQLSFVEVVEGDEPSLVPTDLTGADLKSSYVTNDNVDAKPVVALEFTEDGAKKFSDITARNVGKRLAMILDNEVVSAPVVSAHITNGSAVIDGEFTLESAKNLTIQLNAGALPVPIKLVEERTVGATLGAESVEKSVMAGLVGLGAVLVFMVLVYKKFGLIADVGLIVFGVITLALYKLIPVVLTLPGIAGFLLSVGMAVDSNILIFERFKEEKDNHSYLDAMEISFGRAWDSIRDANVATLVTAFILANPLDWSFLHTSGPVRGFAITLALGIAISLFTGIVVTRNLLRVFIKEK